MAGEVIHVSIPQHELLSCDAFAVPLTIAAKLREAGIPIGGILIPRLTSGELMYWNDIVTGELHYAWRMVANGG